MAAHLKPGTRVRVPWGLGEPRDGVVVEVWGDPSSPSQVRVELTPVGGEDESVLLLLGPDVVTAVPAA